jgi:hypothetical protein
MNSANLEAQLVGKGATIKLREALAAKERPSEFRLSRLLGSVNV